MIFNLNGCKYFKRLRYFPFSQSDDKNYRYVVYVGLGSNINEEKTIKLFMKKVLKDRRLKVIKTSPMLINEAFGYTEQKDFHNAVLCIKTSKSAQEFLKIMLHYEIILGRKRSFKNAPRTLDLDILYFDNLKLKSKKLTLPHIGVFGRQSVFVPLGLIV